LTVCGEPESVETENFILGLIVSFAISASATMCFLSWWLIA
jgi:hypothetical protein